jgi:hypothetical protein
LKRGARAEAGLNASSARVVKPTPTPTPTGGGGEERAVETPPPTEQVGEGAKNEQNEPPPPPTEGEEGADTRGEEVPPPPDTSGDGAGEGLKEQPPPPPQGEELTQTPADEATPPPTDQEGGGEAAPAEGGEEKALTHTRRLLADLVGGGVVPDTLLGHAAIDARVGGLEAQLRGALAAIREQRGTIAALQERLDRQQKEIEGGGLHAASGLARGVAALLEEEEAATSRLRGVRRRSDLKSAGEKMRAVGAKVEAIRAKMGGTRAAAEAEATRLKIDDLAKHVDEMEARLAAQAGVQAQMTALLAHTAFVKSQQCAVVDVIAAVMRDVVAHCGAKAVNESRGGGANASHVGVCEWYADGCIQHLLARMKAELVAQMVDIRKGMRREFFFKLNNASANATSDKESSFELFLVNRSTSSVDYLTTLKKVLNASDFLSVSDADDIIELFLCVTTLTPKP